jgi:hypothetical protein
MRIIDLVGRRFERVLVVSRAQNMSSTDTNARWNCICDCGKEFISYGQDLRREKTKSCGCLTRSKIGALGTLRKTHGMSKTAIYRRWRNMHDRCTSGEKPGYADVSVCERWNSFENFIADMGMPPDGHTLDRKNPFGDYSPENCRWATAKTQANNRRKKTIMLTHDGRTLTVEEWASVLGITKEGMFSRIWKKSPPEIMFAPRIRAKTIS